MATPFECPRCQTTFTDEGDDSAFAECPACGALALAVGDATTREHLTRALSSEHDPEATDEEKSGPGASSQPSGVSDPFSSVPSSDAFGRKGAGVFQGLVGTAPAGATPPLSADAFLEEERTAAVSQAEILSLLSRARADANAGVAAQLHGVPPVAGAFSDEGATEHATSAISPGKMQELLDHARQLDESAAPEWDAFSDERTSTVSPSEMQALLSKARVASVGEHEPVAAAPSHAGEGAVGGGEDATVTLSRAEMQELLADSDEGDDETASAQLPPSLLLTRDDDAHASSARRAAISTEARVDDSVEARVQRSVEEPTGARGEAALPPSLLLTRDDDAASAFAGREAGASLDVPPELSLDDEPPQGGGHERDGLWGSSFTSQEVGPSAVLLSSLEAQGQGFELFDGDALNEDAFGALERAFDEVAMRPDEPPPLPSRAEDALRHMSAAAVLSSVALPTRPEDVAASVPMPPPLRRRQAPHLHLTLSEDAKALAGIPLGKRSEARAPSASVERPVAEPMRPRAQVAPRPASLDETEPVLRRESRARRPARAEPEPELAPPPKVWTRFTLGVAAALALVFLLVGGVAGVAAAPEPERPRATPRARAEQRFADGNRFYQEGRFDDALGSYRGAIAVDRTFAPAYRAKAAALAKQKRYEEAAAAYREYLETAPSAVDAAAVEEVLARYEGGSEP